MILIPLVNNYKSNDFIGENGLSLFIEFKNKTIIFDTGKSSLFIENANKLGIVMNKVDFFIISHGHEDHIGGISSLELEKNYYNIFVEKACLDGKLTFSLFGFNKNIGKNNLILDGIIFKSLFEINSDIFLIKSEKREKSRFYKRNNIIDDFEHEIHLIIIENNQLNIVTGCCHSGILNLIETIKKEFPNKKINSLIGGLHTRSYLLRPIKFFKLIYGLKHENISKLVLGHCTGTIIQSIICFFLKSHKIIIGKKYII